jgi:hypothetical protein
VLAIEHKAEIKNNIDAIIGKQRDKQIIIRADKQTKEEDISTEKKY